MAWTPAQTTINGYSPVLWLDANTISQSDASSVATWADSSSSGNTATQGTAANQPIFYMNQRNGYPAVRFNRSTSQKWIGGGVTGMNTAQFSAFTVMYHIPVPGWVTSCWYMGLGDGAGTSRRCCFDMESNERLRGFQKYASNIPIYNGPIQSLYNNWHLYSCTWDTNGGSNYPAYWLDKAAVSPITRSAAGSGAVSLDSDRYALGRSGNLPNSRSDCFIAEFIYYPTALPDADRQQIEHYLDDKYQICPARVQTAYAGHWGALPPQPPAAGTVGTSRPAGPAAGSAGTSRPAGPAAGTFGPRSV